jgi:hypothetical protein
MRRRIVGPFEISVSGIIGTGCNNFSQFNECQSGAYARQVTH